MKRLKAIDLYSGIGGWSLGLKLNEIEVTPIIKDESESARLAGFAANVGGELEIHVHEDEYERAMMIIRAIAAQQED